jgi:DNA-binding MarR family transcriptional regulator/ribosomal protein S18 acetylase RimI-like enzyme
MFPRSRPEHIAAVREFNRFYTARLGLLRKRHLDGEFSLTEARVLYEIGAAPNVTASTLHNTLDLDPGYLSRLLAMMMRRKLVRHKTSRADGREKLLSLSSLGERKLDDLNHQSALQIHGVIDSLSEADREAVVSSLSQVRSILSRAQRTPIQIVRLAKETQDAQGILQEYYETVNVVVRDKPGAIQAIIDAAASGVWLAYLGKEVVGCVVLRRLESIAKSSECKRLYVKPWARGRGIADKLLDAQEMQARKEGLEWIYLDSYDDLKTAIALYEKRGYERCERYNDNPQATVFMRKKIVGSIRRPLRANPTKSTDPGRGAE